MRTRDERAKRERQIDGTSGRLERNRRERGTREAAIYASQKSPTKRARPLDEELQRGQREDEEPKGGKIELAVSHGESEINRKETAIVLFRIRYKIDIKHSGA